ncbi:MAG TPA: hypothetical protein VNW97_05685 [Candidatus Saccharimonadales bacterium]|nr:hypothetical protein [Candidatus Saccharimonadales bacterium]
MAGTFWNNPQGQTFGYGGAGLGAGTFGFAALALNARQMSRPAVVFTSALDFAAIGAGTAQAVQFRQEWANPQAPAPNNKSIVIGAAFGAAAGTIIGLLLPHKTGNHDHVTKAAASDIMADLSPENRKRSIFLRKLQSTNERGSPVDAPLTNDIGNRSTYNYFKVIEQFRVEDEENRRYQPGNKTYCNIFVWDVTRAMGFEIPHWVADDRGNRHEMRVNQLAGWLNETGKKQGWTHVDARMAQQMANDGHPSIAIWENPNSSISGHIAVIRPGSVGDERGAAISQAGRLVLDASHIDTGFNDPDHEKRVQYWYHE